MRIKINDDHEYYISNGMNAEMQFPSLAWEQKWIVGKPLLDGLPFDFFVMGIDETSTTYRVQVKQSYLYKGKERLDIRKTGASGRNVRYSAFDFDHLCAYDRKEWFLIPYEQVKDKTEIQLCSKKWEKFKLSASQTKNSKTSQKSASQTKQSTQINTGTPSIMSPTV